MVLKAIRQKVYQEKRKNQTLPALEEKKGGGGVEAQQNSYCPPYYFRHLLSKLTWVVLIC